MYGQMEVEEPKGRLAEWLAGPLRRNRALYVKVGVAAAMINFFSLIVALFTMTVYDRIVPNNATESLIGLTIGLVAVMIFDFILKALRAYFVDVAGVNVDREIGQHAFRRLISMPLNAKRGSTGALAGTNGEVGSLAGKVSSSASSRSSSVVDSSARGNDGFMA